MYNFPHVQILRKNPKYLYVWENEEVSSFKELQIHDLYMHLYSILKRNEINPYIFDLFHSNL